MKRIFLYKEGEDYSAINIYENFTHIRAFHGCRTENLNSYYTKGITPLTKEWAHRQIQKTLESQKNISEGSIVSTLNLLWTEPNRVWFAVTKEEIVKRSGHYLLYGSELINSVLTQFGLRNELKKNGKATIFVCDVPLDIIDYPFLENLIENLRDKESLDHLSFPINGTLSSDDIVSHEHPDSSKIYDPYPY